MKTVPLEIFRECFNLLIDICPDKYTGKKIITEPFERFSEALRIGYEMDESNPPSDKKSAEEILEYMKTGAHEWDVFYDPQRMSHYTDGEIYERFVEHLKTIIGKSEEYKNQFTGDKWSDEDMFNAAEEFAVSDLDTKRGHEVFNQWLSDYKKSKQ